MKASSEAGKLKELIDRAIEDQILTRDEYDQIIAMATADGHIDPQEQALLEQLRDMIEDKTIRIAPK